MQSARTYSPQYETIIPSHCGSVIPILHVKSSFLKHFCEQHGGILVVVTTASENNFLKDYLMRLKGKLTCGITLK